MADSSFHPRGGGRAAACTGTSRASIRPPNGSARSAPSRCEQPAGDSRSNGTPWHRGRLGGLDSAALSDGDSIDLPLMTKTDLMDNFEAVDSRIHPLSSRACAHGSRTSSADRSAAGLDRRLEPEPRRQPELRWHRRRRPVDRRYAQVGPVQLERTCRAHGRWVIRCRCRRQRQADRRRPPAGSREHPSNDYTNAPGSWPVRLPESEADSLVIPSNHHPVYWWDHTDRSIAAQFPACWRTRRPGTRCRLPGPRTCGGGAAGPSDKRRVVRS